MLDILLLEIFGLPEDENQTEIELTCVPEEIYYQITEVPMDLPFEV